jgi:hypothetical protein
MLLCVNLIFNNKCISNVQCKYAMPCDNTSRHEFSIFSSFIAIYILFTDVVFSYSIYKHSLFAIPSDHCNIQSVWSKVWTLYIFISCILMPQKCIRSGISCKMYAILTMFSSSDIPFLHFQIKLGRTVLDT